MSSDIALIENNARVGSHIAVELSRLKKQSLKTVLLKGDNSGGISTVWSEDINQDSPVEGQTTSKSEPQVVNNYD